jgi:ubiquinone/menaquinone biosynthesis C-methylase UbiE
MVRTPIAGTEPGEENHAFMPLELLPPEALVRTSEIDHAAWNFEGILGYVSRQRFALVTSLLPRTPVPRLIEIGYGSGVFFPELSKHAAELFGADVHAHYDDVRESLGRAGVAATLVQAPAEALPFDDGFFDVAVAVSTFEFVTDPAKAILEIARVLKPDGYAIVVTPGDNPLLDVALRIFTGESAEKDFGKRRSLIVPALLREMKHDRSKWFPAPWPVPVYRALQLSRRS